MNVAMATYGAVNPKNGGYSSVTDAFFDSGDSEVVIRSVVQGV